MSTQRAHDLRPALPLTTTRWRPTAAVGRVVNRPDARERTSAIPPSTSPAPPMSGLGRVGEGNLQLLPDCRRVLRLLGPPARGPADVTRMWGGGGPAWPGGLDRGPAYDQSRRSLIFKKIMQSRTTASARSGPPAGPFVADRKSVEGAGGHITVNTTAATVGGLHHFMTHILRSF